ncbi:hypothetical protein [Streptomyces sp. JJ38]|uniref:hypothetical protein n=1 Tax=Streptomyces sp. JJ38 TaxID=2738128 RepID=UPI001C567F7F|nr:hypothetical protein [Streptomyces sp. JJ38]MBW1597271.1 hypothetical protein [Streptomyces sp. JJ38]
MSDEIVDGPDDVVGVLTEQIEARFGMDMEQLTAAVAAAPAVHADATDVVKWHGLLTASQAALDRAEDDLLAALETQPSEVDDDPTMDLAHRVNAAVAARDGRAQVVRWLLDPDAPAKKDLAAERLARLRGACKGPAVQTSAPRPPSASPATAPRTRRAAQR